MTLSTTLQSKISRTRKRLSNNPWQLSVITIAVMGLMAVFTFAFRAVSIAGIFGEIEMDIPVMHTVLDDPAYHTFRERPLSTLSKHSPAIVVTKYAFYFGELDAFTSEFAEVRNKFIVRHYDGAPDLVKLLDTMNKWATDRLNKKNIKLDEVVVLLMARDIPMDIGIQIIAGLKNSKMFNRIVLGGGIM